MDVGFGGGGSPICIPFFDGSTAPSLSKSESFLIKFEKMPVGNLTTYADPPDGFTLYRRVVDAGFEIKDHSVADSGPGYWTPCVCPSFIRTHDGQGIDFLFSPLADPLLCGFDEPRGYRNGRLLQFLSPDSSLGIHLPRFDPARERRTKNALPRYSRNRSARSTSLRGEEACKALLEGRYQRAGIRYRMDCIRDGTDSRSFGARVQLSVLSLDVVGD